MRYYSCNIKGAEKHAHAINALPSSEVLIVSTVEELSFQYFVSALINQREMSMAVIPEVSTCD